MDFLEKRADGMSKSASGMFSKSTTSLQMHLQSAVLGKHEPR